MKGRKIGPDQGGASAGDKDWEHEEVPKERNKAPKIMGPAKRKARKHGGKVEGEMPHKHAGRMPRKSGGRAGGSNANPFTSAKTGTQPPWHKTSH